MKFKEPEKIALDRLHTDELNPNEQTDTTFNNLVAEMDKQYFDHPLGVCPCRCSQIDGDHYIIFSGAHRYKGAKVLGVLELPCTVYPEMSDTERRLMLVRRNMLVGSPNPMKMTALVKTLDGIDPKDLPTLLGFDNEREMQRFIVKEKSAIETSFLDSLIEDSRKEKFAVDSLTDIVASIFKETTEEIKQDYLFFTYKGSLVAVVLCDADVRNQIKVTHEYLKRSGETMTNFMKTALKNHLDKVLA